MQFIPYILYGVVACLIWIFLLGLLGSYRFPSDGTLKGRCIRIVQFVHLFVRPSKTSVSILYDLWKRDIFTDPSQSIHLGYWKTTRDLDEAEQDLARLVAEYACLEPKDNVLDVGFGSVQPNVYRIENGKPCKLWGINITQSQVKQARQKIDALHYTRTLDLRYDSAIKLPYSDQSFSKVIALECAFHFETRVDFFTEAYRVLQRGGRLTVADIIRLPTPTEPISFMRWLDAVRFGFWQLPSNNLYTASAYTYHLKRLGFSKIRLQSIREHVYAPLKSYAQTKLEHPDCIQHLHPLHRNALSQKLSAAFLTHSEPFSPLDYVIVTADKECR